MGFKIIVRKNGVQHGESHYTSEAVAAGMAKKMKNSGADVTLARCNGACCATSNPRRTKQPPVWEREGHSQRNPRQNGTTAANLAASRSLVHRAGLSRNPSMDAETASTLIKQLGGSGKLVAMVGAKDFMRTERNGHPALSFKFKGSTKANYVNIALDPSDTYTLQFGKIVKYDLKPTGEFHGVYADQLKRTFEKFTGLYLSL